MEKMSESNMLYANLETEELGNAEIKITGEIPIETVGMYRDNVLARMKKAAEIPGFRKGNVPEKVLIDRVGEMSILNETAEQAVQTAYPQIVQEQQLSLIGRPNITITKLSPGNPIGFSIEATRLPKVMLGDYKQAAREALSAARTPEAATDEEVLSIIEQVQRGYGSKTPDQNAPELTDAFVKQLGDFKDVDDFKSKVRMDIMQEKARKTREKSRIEMGERVIAEAEIELPSLIVESELDRMLGELQSNLKAHRMTLENYLAQIKKSVDDLRSGWREEAKKRAQLQLVLNKIAELENIEVEKETIDRETEHLLAHVKDADPERARLYITTLLTNEAVFKFLESQKGTVSEQKEKPPQIARGD
jgi:FKBP-type peptidyl-prolyl cis-trans isomerase (trigger factor)